MWISTVPAATVLLISAGCAKAAAPKLPYGTWVIAGQTCPDCTDTAAVPELNGATLVIGKTAYQDAVIGTDICPGAPTLHSLGETPLSVALASPPAINPRGLAAMLPRNAQGERIEVTCSVPALAPYTGKILAHLAYLPPTTLLYLWDDNALLFRLQPATPPAKSPPRSGTPPDPS